MERPHNQYIRPLLTDLYQITMCYAYWKNGHHMDHAVFDAFFRKCPFKGEYTVFAGLSEVIEFLENFRFNQEEVNYIRTLIPHAESEFFDWLLSIDASQLKVYAIPEGTLVFPRINLLRIEGPLAIAQLCETTMLVLCNYASLITTNAARFRKAAGKDKVMLEFGLRRAQGPDGAMTASKYSYLGGFDSTSNALAGMIYGIPVSGTHAHSYIASYVDYSDFRDRLIDGQDILQLALDYRRESGFTTNDGELTAFASYAKAFPNAFLALVDTYDTLGSGIPNFLCVALALYKIGHKPVGIRLDSGDLAYLSIQARAMFKKTSEKFNVPFEDLKIVASNDINETVIHSLNDQKHQIDVFGVGTNLVTCQSQPALGMVYKLVEIREHPRIKLSNEKDKITIPCKKNAFRLFGESGEAICDVLMMSDEAEPQVGTRMLVRHPFDERKRMFVVPSKVEKLHKLIWDGRLVEKIPSLSEGRERLQMQIEAMRNDITRAINPTPYKISLSSNLYDYLQDLWNREVPIQEFR
ncbi:unnamed protein product [Blepharisma stoltei]|uniref:Nicotinate phosphoribosyltransferase n=1 Tax=Blepharisma stoltei TaxID=1481888 RepID=A0AAU9JCF4_9CILI|nr:unnamed protein product [Blepharisma stoltei]